MEESIVDFEEKGKWYVDLLKSPLWSLLLIILVGISAFAWGRLSALSDGREPTRVLQGTTEVKPLDNAAAAFVPQGESLGKVVGSKNGTKYHLSTCPGAKKISAKNLITFSSVEEARAKGYTPASNCPGLK